MRIDRLITLGLVSPARWVRTILPASSAHRSLSVLMYHSVSAEPETGVSPYYKVCVSPSRFAEHMQWLADWGYRGVTLTQGLRLLQGKSPASDALRPVAITFDDGFRDFATNAVPALHRHGFSATMYLPTAFIGEERRMFKNRECLTWSEVQALHREGMEFGSHTVNHPELVGLDWPAIETELRESKATIEQRLATSAPAFAYPYAFPSAKRAFVSRLHALLEAARYESCVTTEIGEVRPSDEPLRLKRLPVNDADDAALLRAKLAGNYNWLNSLQQIVKEIKSR